MASIYTRNGVWQIKYLDKGKWVQKSLKTASKSRANEEKKVAERKEQTERLNLPVHRQKRLTFDDLETRYKQWADIHNRRPSTVYVNLLAVKKWVEITGVKDIGAIRPRNILDFKQTRLGVDDESAREPRTVNANLTGLRALVNLAIREGWYVGKNPFANVEMLREKRELVQFLSREQIQTWLLTAREMDRDIYLFSALCIYAGLRKDEALSAKPAWVDYEKGLLSVKGEPPHFYLKDHEERAIPLNRELAAILKEHAVEGPYIIRPQKGWGKNRYRVENKKVFKALSDKAGLSWVHPHILRHTFASQLVSKGVSIYKVCKWMGHADVRTTMIYAHLAPDKGEIDLI